MAGGIDGGCKPAVVDSRISDLGLASSGGHKAPSVRVYLPAPPLRAYVTFYYFVEAFGPLTDFLYPEWGNVRLSVAGDWTVVNDPRDGSTPNDRVLFGPTDRRGKILTGGGKTVGFGLTPLALQLRFS